MYLQMGNKNNKITDAKTVSCYKIYTKNEWLNWILKVEMKCVHFASTVCVSLMCSVQFKGNRWSLGCVVTSFPVKSNCLWM